MTLVGFGTFYVGKRAARTGRNPRTGAAIKIKAAKVPKFRAGKASRIGKLATLSRYGHLRRLRQWQASGA